jgi:hypothetical protein
MMIFDLWVIAKKHEANPQKEFNPNNRAEQSQRKK